MKVDTVIVDALRTPIGRAFKGSLRSVRPDDLAALVVAAILERQPAVAWDQIDDVICGVAAGAGEQGFNLGRVVGQLAGLPNTVPGTSVNRFCASSLQAVRMAHHAIQAGEGSTFVVVGVESVSRRPTTFRAADHNPRMTDRSHPDFVNEMYMSMVETAERVAARYKISRQEMDEFSVLSHRRAIQARKSGITAREILPVDTADGIVDEDDGPRPNATLETLSRLRPVMGEGGLITAGNACPVNDGAAAALIMSSTRAEELGLTVRARIVGTQVTALAPERMGLGPIDASRLLLRRAGLDIKDIDVVELNEAFAAQVLPVCQELGIDIESQLNPLGGAIALGHPFGMTGVRMLTTLLNSLESTDSALGLQTLCVGGGQGMSMVIERPA